MAPLPREYPSWTRHFILYPMNQDSGLVMKKQTKKLFFSRSKLLELVALSDGDSKGRDAAK